MYKLKIKVTKDILRRSMMCGTNTIYECVSQNCAIALACREIFPGCDVGSDGIEGVDVIKTNYWKIRLPSEAGEFISKFDRLVFTPEERLNLPELEFEVELNDDVLACINIDEAKEVLKTSETLKLIEL